MGRLDGKVAIITGGGSGMGEATSILFAKEGAKVIVADWVAEGGERVVKKIKDNGGEATFVKVDVSKAVDAQKMVKTAVDTYGKLNILFNNAGIQGPMGIDLADYPVEEGEKIIAVNFEGVWFGMKYAIPEMLKAGGGSIISTASLCAFIGYKGISIYCATKGAIVALSRTVANEYARRGIRCNTINPSSSSTPLHADLLKPEVGRKVFQNVAEQIPMGRTCEPDDVAYAALFLASDESQYITGTDLMVDGGWRIKGL